MSRLPVALAVLALAACGLPPSTPLKPKLSSIQARLFNQYCISCHAPGLTYPALDLTTGKSFESLVGKPTTSTKWPGSAFEGLALVEPGQPNASALMKTLEHHPYLNAALRMPGGRKLPDDRVAVVRKWITDGAKND